MSEKKATKGKKPQTKKAPPQPEKIHKRAKPKPEKPAVKAVETPPEPEVALLKPVNGSDVCLKASGGQFRWSGPVNQSTELSHWTVWFSCCGRYRVVRSISKFGDTNNFAASFGMLTVLGDSYRSLNGAMRACEEHYQAHFPVVEMVTNREQVVDAAIQDGTSTVPAAGTSSASPAGKPVREKKSKPSTGQVGARYYLFDMPVKRTLMWMGKQQWPVQDARKALNKLGLSTVPDTSIKGQMARGRKESVTELTAEQIRQLEEARK